MRNLTVRLLLAFAGSLPSVSTAADGLLGGSEQTASFAKWSKIELSFAGLTSEGYGNPNPFAFRFSVTFTSPSGRTYQTPGFYDGDGRGGLDGDIWKVRFSADETGRWTYATHSNRPRLDGDSGWFTVTPVEQNAQGFWRLGRLEYTGTAENGIRYMKFRDGSFWLKAGCDDPENFLGNCRHYDTPAKRRAAVDFLADRGVNSLYIMTHNVSGDDNDVWPWLGATPREAMSNGGQTARFDVRKLDEWDKLFEYMQTKGVVPYLVLEDDSAWSGYDHARYYREMIARFGYLPALMFNFGEEHNENYRLSQALDYMQLLKESDPYDHPRGIHNVNRANDEYVDSGAVDFTSIQTGSPGTRKGVKNALEHNQIAIDWIDRCQSRGRRVLMTGFDEARPEEERRCWWSVYLGGGVWETHVRKPYGRPLSAWEPAWTQLGGARAYMESLPFWEMETANDVVRAGTAFCLANRGRVYALYLPAGGEVELNLPTGRDFMVAWWRPTQGRSGRFTHPSRIGGGRQILSAPAPGDWAARLVVANKIGPRETF